MLNRRTATFSFGGKGVMHQGWLYARTRNQRQVRNTPNRFSLAGKQPNHVLHNLFFDLRSSRPALTALPVPPISNSMTGKTNSLSSSTIIVFEEKGTT